MKSENSPEEDPTTQSETLAEPVTPKSPSRTAKVVAILGVLLFVQGAFLISIQEYDRYSARQSITVARLEPMEMIFPEGWVGFGYTPDIGFFPIRTWNSWDEIYEIAPICLLRIEISPENPIMGDDIVVSVVGRLQVIDPNTPVLESPLPFNPALVDPSREYPCFGIVDAPGLGVEEWRVIEHLSLGEEVTIAKKIMSPISSGRKSISVVNALGNVSLTTLEVAAATKTGLPKWAEGWAPVVAMFLGPMLSLPYWIEIIRNWRRRHESTSDKDRSRILDGIRRGK